MVYITSVAEKPRGYPDIIQRAIILIYPLESVQVPINIANKARYGRRAEIRGMVISPGMPLGIKALRYVAGQTESFG